MQLSKREKNLLAGLIIFISVLLIYYLIITPFLSFKNDMDSSKKNNILYLQKLDTIYRQYREVKSEKDRYERLLRNNRGISSLIEENAQKTGILTNKVYNRERQANIQNKYKKITSSVKFEGVDIKSALKFIYLMEYSNKLMKVSYLRISQAIKEKNTYDVRIKFESFKKE